MQPRDTQTEKIFSSASNNPNIPSELPQACLKAMFDSSKTFGLFTSQFDEELYHYASSYYVNHDFARDRPIYSVVSIAKVLEDVEISQRNRLFYQDMKRFLEQDFVTIHDEETKIPPKFRSYLTARLDIKLMSSAGDFQIISVSDKNAGVLKPDWLQQDGIGYQIHSYIGKLKVVVKATADGQMNLFLRGLDMRSPQDKSKRIPYWIDYTKLAINGKIIFNKLTPICHDKFYAYKMDVKFNKEIEIQVEWLPHRSDT